MKTKKQKQNKHTYKMAWIMVVVYLKRREKKKAQIPWELKYISSAHYIIMAKYLVVL